MATIVHFNVTAEEPARAEKFYRDLFGWKFTLLPGPMNYYLIETSDLDGAKGVGGGMSKRENEPSGIVNYIGVASIDASLDKVKQLGGKVVIGRQDLPGWGSLAVCIDTENNMFGLFEEAKS